VNQFKRIFTCDDCGFEWQAKWWQFGDRLRDKADLMHWRAHNRLMNNFEQFRQGWENIGAWKEKTRIVKVLETLRCPDNSIAHDCTDQLAGYTVNEIIKLIEKETLQKENK
jgi:hypothetical protein